MALITVENVSYSYPDPSGQPIPALKNVSLTIRPGEWVAILGANGSGKSTLAKHLNALLVPKEGRVSVNELDTSDKESWFDIRRTVGMVFQNPDNQIVATTVEEDIAFGPENLGLPPREIVERVEKALRDVGLEGMRTRPPHDLSGGQKQRVAIAGVLALGPEYLVLDEATSMLDPVSRREVLETVRHLHENQGMTVVTITHDMDEAALAHRIIVMDQGSVLLEGSPVEVFSQSHLLIQAGLEVPPALDIARRLWDKGLSIDPDVLTLDKLVNVLCRLKSLN
ncbi:energy-coupling factor transporter ATPase [Heliobacterium chlorum]|uniref:Energy-coupling factor transporter ATPase n=1 Tax=Heliobacterium chlorum TaxID=2698 RepID=A0ABR7T3D0_HELCL|nr:energy-coupling factor transporter ATPase [Heliobacterium chlorum]MBC9785284.1 energy-coupling factor transporter ATPase [Heliobacterium chlorum]